MAVRLIVFYFVLFVSVCKSQVVCGSAFVKDTMSVPESGKVLEGEYIEVTLKDFSTVRIFRTDDDKYFLKFVVKQNFYFDKIDVLEIRSGSKSYYVKNTKQYKIDKTTGLFVVEVFKNYISTLKDDGMTSIYFAKAETDFTKRDAGQIKEMAKCFYDVIKQKK